MWVMGKIIKIHHQLSDCSLTDKHHWPEVLAPATLISFNQISPLDLNKIITSSPIKSSSIDPIPATLFRQVYTHLLPVLTTIINKSLATGFVPDCLKEAMLTPILKKPNLDQEDLNNYRPISNLPYVSKLLERVVAAQLVKHLNDHGIAEQFQSAYRKLHSTETALLYVTNDILNALDAKNSVFLVLLDLSTAFDTVDHKKLLERLEKRVRLGGLVLDWVVSYLSSRY